MFFLCNVFATIEITAFLGFKSIVKKAIKDSSIMFSMYVDFKLAEKIIIIITAMMMAYAMSLYLELRANDYTNFIILGMRRKRAYKMIIFEYLIGWLGSFSVGIILGAAAVRGGQHLVKSLYPGLIDITKVSWNVYFSVVKLSVIIMLATFFLLMLWLDDRDLSNMAKKKIPKKRKASSPKRKISDEEESPASPSTTDVEAILKVMTESLPLKLSPLGPQLMKLLQKKDESPAMKKTVGQRK